MPRHTTWLKAAIVFLLITGGVHAISLFVQPTPENDTERQLITLMNTYRLNLGLGFERTMGELSTALSSCFTFVCLLGAMTLAYLLRRDAPADILKGVVGIHALLFSVLFLVLLVYTFLPPIVLTGLSALCLSVAWFTMPDSSIR